MKTISDFTEEELKNMFIDCMPVIQLRNERNYYKQALNEIRELIKNNSIEIDAKYTEVCCSGDDILQIIDKVLGDEK